MTAPLLWICADCNQHLPRYDAPCDCPNLSGDRCIATPLGTVLDHTRASLPRADLTRAALPTLYDVLNQE